MNAESDRAVAACLETDCVIEISRIRRVDGDNGQAGQVFAIGEGTAVIVGVEPGQGGAGFFKCLRGKLVDQAVGANYRERFDFGRAGNLGT